LDAAGDLDCMDLGALEESEERDGAALRGVPVLADAGVLADAAVLAGAVVLAGAAVSGACGVLTGAAVLCACGFLERAAVLTGAGVLAGLGCLGVEASAALTGFAERPSVVLELPGSLTVLL